VALGAQLRSGKPGVVAGPSLGTLFAATIGKPLPQLCFEPAPKLINFNPAHSYAFSSLWAQ
jgi:hypothetical protein